MHIRISSGIGTGPTELAAFDQALVDAGVANFNLIYLSSVLPPKSEVVEVTPHSFAPDGEWGDRLYVVMAQKRGSRRNHEVWAGIGWIQDESTGAGLLVEHEGHGESEVREDIENSLHALAQNRSRTFGSIHMAVTGIKCKGQPACALTVAVFEAEPWRKNA